MNRIKTSIFIKNVTTLLIVTMTLLSIAPPVNAGFIPSVDPGHEATLGQDLEVISTVLENKVVKQRLNDLGYSDQEIQERLNQLTNEEIHKLALQMESLNQGGVLGLVIGVLAVVVLVLVIMRLT